MPDSRHPTKTFLIFAAIMSCAPFAAGAQDVVPAANWTISCSHNGRLVHREHLPSQGADVRQRELVQRYPDATCVLVAPPAPMPTITDILQMPIGAEHDSASIDAALRAITGEDVPTAPTHAPAPVSREPQLQDISSPPRYLPNDPEWVRLATYHTTEREDVLADWHRIASDSPWLGTLIPSTITSNDGWIVLSVGPVKQHERPEFCLAVQARGFPCETIPITSPALPESVVTPFGPGDQTTSCPAPSPMTPYGLPEGGRLADRACWRSTFARTHAAPPRLVEASSSIPLPRPRPEGL